MVKIFIPELDDDVEFEGKVTYYPGHSGSMYLPPEEAGYYADGVDWDESKYTPEQNLIIENYREQAGDKLEKECEREADFDL